MDTRKQLVLGILLLATVVGCKSIKKKETATGPTALRALLTPALLTPALPVLSATFTPAQNTNTRAITYWGGIVGTNYITNLYDPRYVTTNVWTNFSGGCQASMEVTVEWESVPGKTYAVEFNRDMADPTPWVFSGSTNGWIGSAWQITSLPVLATNTVSRWKGGVWGDALDGRMYRIKEL